MEMKKWCWILALAYLCLITSAKKDSKGHRRKKLMDIGENSESSYGKHGREFSEKPIEEVQFLKIDENGDEQPIAQFEVNNVESASKTDQNYVNDSPGTVGFYDNDFLNVNGGEDETGEICTSLLNVGIQAKNCPDSENEIDYGDLTYGEYENTGPMEKIGETVILSLQPPKEVDQTTQVIQQSTTKTVGLLSPKGPTRSSETTQKISRSTIEEKVDNEPTSKANEILDVATEHKKVESSLEISKIAQTTVPAVAVNDESTSAPELIESTGAEMPKTEMKNDTIERTTVSSTEPTTTKRKLNDHEVTDAITDDHDRVTTPASRPVSSTKLHIIDLEPSASNTTPPNAKSTSLENTLTSVTPRLTTSMENFQTERSTIEEKVDNEPTSKANEILDVATEHKKVLSIKPSDTTTSRQMTKPVTMRVTEPTDMQNQNPRSQDADLSAASSSFPTTLLIACVIAVVVVLIIAILIIVVVHARLKRRGKYAITSEAESGNAAESEKAGQPGEAKVVTVHYNDTKA